MAGSFQSIFKRHANAISLPQAEKPTMRALEPRVLLDAAAIETAIDVAGKTAHTQLADDYAANSRAMAEATDQESRTSINDAPSLADDGAELEGLASRRVEQEIVFIDAAVPDIDQLIASLEVGVVVHVLDADSDGVEQIAQILGDSGGYTAVHIFSHGVAGALNLGDATLDATSINGRHAEALRIIGEALSDDGDILIYGCDFGQGDLGRLAAARLAQATGADVAASDDLTGSESLAGDWDLEIETGKIETASFTAPDWENILQGYTFAALGDPDIGHLTGGIVGTANTFARWDGAVTYDPGNGDPLQTFDLQATLVGLTENTTATFETTASDSATLDDFRVVITNVSPVEQTINGEDVLELGQVAVRWSVLVPGTQNFAPPDVMNILLRDIEGLGGTPDTRQTVSVESAAISEYTVEQSTSLDIGLDEVGLAVSGTQQGNNDIGSQISVAWESNSSFRVIYGTRTFAANFDMIGNDGLSTFGTTETTRMQVLDLNGDNEAGLDFSTTYINGAASGTPVDVPVSIVDLDLSIFDFDDDRLASASVTLTNAQAGDTINFDTSLLNALGLTTSLSQDPPLPAPANTITLDITGQALISNYLTALQSITYSNDLPDVSFDRVTDRILDISISDGVLTTTAQTTIGFTEATNTPVVGNDVYVENEDTPIIANAAQGLLSNDSDPNGDALTITGASDPTGVALVAGPGNTLVNPVDGGGASLLASGASISINTLDGSFTYTPAPNYSGTETFSYTIRDASNFRTGFVTFDIQPVVDSLTLDIVGPDPMTDPGVDEDVSSLPISFSATSPDTSETQEFFAEEIPDGVAITDGVNTFRSEDGDNFVDITNWDLTQLRVLPVEHSDEEISILFVAINTEIDGSDTIDDQWVTFRFNAVADVPVLIVDRADAGIDEDVDLSLIIQPSLIDRDGSERLTEILISDIPAGSEILVNGASQTITNGSVSLSPADIPVLTFRPPQIGTAIVYTLTVTATATEQFPNGTVTLASATTVPVDLIIDLNNNDNPVIALDDTATTFAGQRVIIDVLANDSFPDGGERVSQINGQDIDFSSSIDLPGGEGTVSLDTFGSVALDVSPTFSGEVRFTYQLTDIDGSVDDAEVTVSVQPRWVLSDDITTSEGNDARFSVSIEGAVPQGTSISTDIGLTDLSAEAADHATLVDSINDSIIALGQNEFSFDGTTITYTAGESNYISTYDPTTNSFYSIASTGTALSLGNDGIVLENIGFDFSHYADTYNSVYISANGYLTFGSPASEPTNTAIDGNALGGRALLAPYWDDLDTTTGNVFVETRGTIPGERQFVIEWNNVSSLSGGGGTGTFQIVLFEKNGRIVINYDDVNFGGAASNAGQATIGAQSAGTLFDEFSFNATTIASGSSLIMERGFTALPTLIIDVPIVDDPDFEDVETFRIDLFNSVDSSIGNSDAIASIDVSDNTAPVANDDMITTPERTSVTVNVIDPNNSTTGEPGEDFDAEGHALTLTEVNGTLVTNTTVIVLPSGATVTANPSGIVTYNPGRVFDYLATGETASDSFDYYIVDSFGGSSGIPATVNVTITGVNQAPVVDLNDAGASINPSFSIVYRPTDNAVAVADIDAAVVDPDDNTFTGLTLTLGGILQGSLEQIYVGDLVIPYGSAASTQTANVGVDVYDVTYDGVDGISIVQQGGAELTQTQIDALVRSVQYENLSTDDEPGTRTIDFASADAENSGTASTASIFVVGNNNAPVALDDFPSSPVVTNEETPVTISIANLLANDSDPDVGDTFSLVSVDGGPNGTAVLDGIGGVIFTPNTDYSGTTFFEYTIEDINGAQDTASVFVSVTNINDAPRVDLDGNTAGNDYTYDYTENDPATPIVDLSGSVIDVDNTQLTELIVRLTSGQIGDLLTVGTLPPGITASVVPAVGPQGLVSPGAITVTLSGASSVANYETALRGIGFLNASDNPSTTQRVIEVTASDGSLTSTLAQTLINVIAVNDAPVTAPDGPFDVNEDETLTLSPASLLGNDIDAEDDAMQIISVQDADNGGTVILNGGGDVVYTPAPNYFGPASFTYTVDDGNGGLTTETVSINVVSVNDVAQIDLDANTPGTGYSNMYTEGLTPANIVDTTFSISDIDDTNLQGATVILNNGFAGDVLGFGTLPPGVSAALTPAVPLAADGVLTLTFTGTASLADYNALLQTVTLSVGTDAPSEVVRNIDVLVNDGDDDSNVARTNVTVTGVNDAPIAVNDTIGSVSEDQVRIITAAELTGNDSDPDLESFNIVSVQAATNGTVVLNGDGTVTFTPTPDYFGAASFTYTIEDADGAQSTATANLNVASVNDVTVIDLDANTAGSGFSTTYNEDDSVGVSLVDPTLTIFDVDDTNLQSATLVLTDGQIGDELAIAGALPPGISALISPSGNLISAQTVTLTLTGNAPIADYTAALQQIVYRSSSQAPTDVSATRSISITTRDSADDSNTAITTVNVIASNDDPVLVTDTATVDEDAVLTLSTSDLLFNDSDPDGDSLTVTAVGTPVNGTVSLVGTTVTFIPDANFNGSASFEYTATDGNGGTISGLVNVTVNPINDAPTLDLNSSDVGSNDYATSFTEGDPALAVSDASVLLGDVDGNAVSGATIVLTNGQVGDALQVGMLPGNISATITPSGALTSGGTYTVQLSGNGTFADYQTALQAVYFNVLTDDPSTIDRTIDITVTDGVATSAIATTTITVTSVNDAPTVLDDGPYSINEDQPFIITIAELLFNDSDPEGDALDVVSVQNPANGTVTLDGAGEIVFTPDANYFGPASFTYTVRDALGAETIGTVNIDVVSVNDPVAIDLNAGTAGTGHSTNYVENDLGIALVDASAVLTDVDNSDLQSATFTLSNGRVGDILEVGTLPAGLSATVTPSIALSADGPITLIISGLANQADYLAAIQAVTYRSVSEFPSEVTRSISLVINDTIEDSIPVTTQIAVLMVNDVPVAVADGTYSFDEDTVLTIPATDLLVNDSDLDLDLLSVVSVQNAVNGSVTLSAGGDISFTPDAAYFGPASFDYTVSDGNGGTAVATVSLDVLFVNDPPVLNLDGVGGTANYAVTYVENDPGLNIVDIDVVLTDEDHADMQSAEIVLTNGQAGDLLEIGTLPGTMSAMIVPGSGLSAAGEIRISLTGTASLADYEAALRAITYRSTSEQPDETPRVLTIVVNDGFDNSAEVTTTITVVSVNDAPVANDDGVPVAIDTLEDTALIFDPVTANDVDVENDPLTITAIDGQAIVPGGQITSVSGAEIALDADGKTVTFTPPLNFFGSTSFVYTLSDGALTDTAQVSINVISVNDAPIANDDGPVTLAEDTQSDFDPVSNDSDVENDPLNVVTVDGQSISIGGTVVVANGTVTLGGDGRTLRYVPSADYFGSTSITYGVSDGQDTTEASVTYDVTPVDDPLAVVGTPIDLNAFDAEVINLDMSTYVVDVDGDDVLYTAVGLPSGLSINPTTGVVSGTIASDASVTSPYAITVTADDRVASQVDLNFVMTVTNVPPVSVGDALVVLEDGAPFTYDASQLFNDPDGDALMYDMTGLPSWSTFDPVTGVITGTVPSDASVTGALPASVTVDDGQGGTASLVLTIDPQNVPPVVNNPVSDLIVSEEDTVEIDLNGRYADGGFDADPITISVAGLPDGVNFDAATGIISGIAELGTASILPYVVTVTLDDGQGGITEDVFTLRVGRDDYLDDKDVFASLDDLTDQDAGGDESDKQNDLGISSVINAIQHLNGTQSLDTESGIVLSGVNAVSPLAEATNSDGKSGVTDAADNISDMLNANDWANKDGWISSSDWSIDSEFGYETLSQEKSEREIAGIDDRLNRIEVTSFVRNDEIYVEVNNKLDPQRDGQIVQIVIGGENGSKLPAWVKMVREGLLKMAPPADHSPIILEMVFTLGSSHELTKTVSVNLQDGTTTDLSSPGSELNEQTGKPDSKPDGDKVAEIEIDNRKPVEATH